MERSNLLRNVLLFAAASVWVFLLLALASFSATDWPSHAVQPYPPIKNLCGSAGAFISYYLFLFAGQGVFPVLFFTGVCLVLCAFDNPIGDLWMRAVGLLLLAVAFAAAVHHFRPGTGTGLPEGQGGIIGIAASHFLQLYFNTVGTRLILLTTLLIGLLLAADDLVLQTPGAVTAAYAAVKERAPQINWNFIPIPQLPALPKFVTKEAVMARVAAAAAASAARRDERSAAAAKSKADAARAEKPGRRDKAAAGVAAQAVQAVVNAPDVDDDAEMIDLEYDDDAPEPAPAAVDGAFVDGDDPAPSEAAVIPPAEADAADDDEEEEADEDGESEEGDEDADAEDSEGDGEADDAPATMSPPEIRRDIIVKLPAMLRPRQESPRQMPMELGEYQLPHWDLLDEPEGSYSESQEQFVREQAAQLEQALKDFNIDARVVEIDTGPVITMYEISLAPGIKVSAISALSNDIQRSLKAETVRIVAPIPGKNTVGIEVPNEQKEKVLQGADAAAPTEQLAKMSIPLFLGKAPAASRSLPTWRPCRTR